MVEALESDQLCLCLQDHFGTHQDLGSSILKGWIGVKVVAWLCKSASYILSTLNQFAVLFLLLRHDEVMI
jgi:hypothetical protein